MSYKIRPIGAFMPICPSMLVAGQFAAGKTVLDAGCGTGYGADYLLRKGARSVYAIDNSEAALQFCRTKYKDRRLQYIAADLTAFHSQELPSIDLLFCSNVLEHVWRVDTALAALTRCLTRDSVAVIAVPPVVDAGMLEGNLANPYHLNNLPPQTWMKKLGRFFEQVQGYRHWLRPRWLDENNWPISMDAAPEKTAIREIGFHIHRVHHGGNGIADAHNHERHSVPPPAAPTSSVMQRQLTAGSLEHRFD